MHGGHFLFGSAFVMIVTVVCLIAALVIGVVGLMVAAWCMIFKRAGYPWPIGLLSLIPIANVVMVLVLAFSKWPVEHEVEELRTFARHYYPAPPTPGAYAPGTPQATYQPGAPPSQPMAQ